MNIFYGIIGFLLINYPLHGFQETIKVEANELKTLNLSEIATSSESIVLEIPSEMEDRQFFDLTAKEDYIFALTINNGNGPSNSRLFQFQSSGKFVQEIGKSTDGWNSLFLDEKNKIIGVNNGEKIFQYNFQGEFLGEIKAIEMKQIVHNERQYGVEVLEPFLTLADNTKAKEILDWEPTGDLPIWIKRYKKELGLSWY